MAEAILYTSATGFTRRYAHMLGERTGLPVFELGKQEPAPGTGVIYLGWLLAGSVKGLARARKKWRVEAVCAVGMSLPEQTGGLAESLKLGSLPFFYLRGGYAPARLGGVYRAMMWMMTRKVTAHPPKDREEAAVQEVFLHGGDFVEEKALAEVLSWLTEKG